MKAMHAVLLAALPLFSFAGSAIAQSAHYPSGVEGLKGATLPPPGLYFRDYNYFYTADRFPGGPSGFDVDVYVQAPRLIGITDQTFLGGYYGWDVLFTFPYQDVTIGSFNKSEFGMGDIFIEPVTLSWHEQQFDAAVGYGVWAPTGKFDPVNPASPGKGFWTHMLTAGATWYFDADKTWALSALNRYEFNTETQQTDFTRGDVWTLEYGLSKTFCKTIDVGLAGYYVLQTTDDTGTNSTESKDQVFGIGPEVNVFWPKIGIFTSARYVFEAGAKNRTEGHVFNLTLTKPL